MWASVLVAVVASAGNNIGKVLQKQATDQLPRLSLDNKVLKAYLRSALWVTGLAVDLLGAVLMLEAVAHAPVSVVQPVSGCGMAVMAVFSHVYLKEPMSRKDWLGVTLAAAGTLGVGFCAEGSTSSPGSPNLVALEQGINVEEREGLEEQEREGGQQGGQQQQQQGQGVANAKAKAEKEGRGQIGQGAQGQGLSRNRHKEQSEQRVSAQQPRIAPLGLLLFLTSLLLILLGSEAWLTSRRKSKKRPPLWDTPQPLSAGKAEVLDEVLAGCQAGCCFGLSAAAVKTGFLASTAAAAASATAGEGGLSMTAKAAAGAGAGAGSLALSLHSVSAWLLRGGIVWAALGIATGVALSSSGFFFQTRGFKEGRAVVVSTCAGVASIITAVTGGMVALGEALPRTSFLRLILFCSWVLILVGICFLVGDKTTAPSFDSLRPHLRPSFSGKRGGSSNRLGPPSVNSPGTTVKHKYGQPSPPLQPIKLS